MFEFLRQTLHLPKIAGVTLLKNLATDAEFSMNSDDEFLPANNFKNYVHVVQPLFCSKLEIYTNLATYLTVVLPQFMLWLADVTDRFKSNKVLKGR